MFKKHPFLFVAGLILLILYLIYKATTKTTSVAVQPQPGTGTVLPNSVTSPGGGSFSGAGASGSWRTTAPAAMQGSGIIKMPANHIPDWMPGGGGGAL